MDTAPLYDQIAEELAAGQQKPGLWLRSLTECSGDEPSAKAKYVKLRISELQSANRTQGIAKRIANPNYFGVKGWLAFFCIILIGTPLLQLLKLFAAGDTAPTSNPTPDHIHFDVFLQVVIGVYSFVIGCILYSGQEGAAQKARCFLIVSAIVSLVQFCLYLPLSNPTAGFASYSLQRMLHSELFCLVWYIYLRRSVRVRATYFEVAPVHKTGLSEQEWETRKNVAKRQSEFQVSELQKLFFTVLMGLLVVPAIIVALMSTSNKSPTSERKEPHQDQQPFEVPSGKEDAHVPQKDSSSVSTPATPPERVPDTLERLEAEFASLAKRREDLAPGAMNELEAFNRDAAEYARRVKEFRSVDPSPTR